MTWPATIGTASIVAALAVITAVLWLRYGETLFVERLVATLAGCF